MLLVLVGGDLSHLASFDYTGLSCAPIEVLGLLSIWWPSATSLEEPALSSAALGSQLQHHELIRWDSS